MSYLKKGDAQAGMVVRDPHEDRIGRIVRVYDPAREGDTDAKETALIADGSYKWVQHTCQLIAVRREGVA